MALYALGESEPQTPGEGKFWVAPDAQVLGRVTLGEGASVWYGAVVRGEVYGDAAEFLNLKEYANVQRWVAQIGERPAVQRGRMVNRSFGPTHEQLRERHAASDFETRRQDMLEVQGS